MKFRKPARRLSLRKRYLALTANERVKLSYLQKQLIQVIMVVQKCKRSIQVYRFGLKVAHTILMSIILLAADPSHILPPCKDRKMVIDSFDESTCWNFFETRKQDLPRLYKVLCIPNIVRLENGSKMPGEEVMLRGLYELVSGNDKNEIAINVFGRDFSQQSRAFKWFINHIYYTFSDLVTDNLKWWYENGYLHQSMEAIKAKFGGNDLFTTCGFIDCNCLECSRPGGGPAEEGSDAARWDPLIQKAFYNGWKSIHGLKHQTFDCAFGMTVDLYGPNSLRRNDLKLLRLSRLNQRLRELQTGAEKQLNINGDSIYPRLSHLHSSWRHAGATNLQREENRAYTKVRVSIEWNYMVTCQLYSYLNNQNKLRLLGSSSCTKVYTVATILRNAHVAMYGSETSFYFNVLIPPNFLEKYFQLEGY